MRRLDFFVALNEPWQLIKTLKTKLWIRRLTQLTAGRYMVDWHMWLRKSLFLQFCIYFITYKFTRKPLLGNLFVVDRIFFKWFRPEDIQYCHSRKLKLKTAGSWISWNFYNFFWLYQWQYFRISLSVLQRIVLTNIVRSVRVSLKETRKRAIWKNRLTLE